MTHIRLFAAATLIAGLLTGCGSDSGLRSPDPKDFSSEVNTDVLVGLPWRDAQQMAQDAGWWVETFFFVEGETMVWTMDLHRTRLRIVVTGGEKGGTVTRVHRG